MDFRSPGKVLGNFCLIASLFVLCGVAGGQSDNKKQNKSAPPPHASAPAHNAPAPQRPANNNMQRPAGNGNAQRPNNMNNGARNNGTGMNNSRGGAMNNSRPGATNNARGGNMNNAGGNRNNGAAAGRSNGAGNNSRTASTNTRGRGAPVTTRSIQTRSGVSAQATYKGGRVRSIQAGNMRIDHTARGQRRIETVRNGRTIVTEGRRGGYMQRAYLNRNGRMYVQRTYVVGGRTYVYAYHSYNYRGYAYYGYAPAYYYHPVYYGWAYNPWPAPVYYNWGYASAPWYGYYGYYYAPYPAYPMASLWLTDYLISENLRLAYEASQSGKTLLPKGFEKFSVLHASLWPGDSLISGNLLAAPDFFLEGEGAGSGTQAQLTPEVKQELADEVKAQIAEDKAAAEATQQKSGDETPAALDPKHKIFVVSSSLDTSTTDGDDCSLSQGDILERASDTADADNNVEMAVKSSQKNDCSVGAHVTIAATDLQEMHNHFREKLDGGMKSLADKSGKDGLPAAPDTTTKGGEVPPPAADNNATGELQQQQKDADQVEADVPSQDASSPQ